MLFRPVWFRLRALLAPRAAERELDEEVRYHFDRAIERHVAAGMTRADATAAARREFGNELALKEEARDAFGLRVLRDLGADSRYALRLLRRSPGYTAVAVLSLALGVGANAAMFGVVDRLLLRGPEHVRDPGRVRRVQVTMRAPGRPVTRMGWLGYVSYDILRRGQSFEQVAAYFIAPEAMVVGRGAEARRVTRGEATATFFPLLGVQPALGRFYTEAEDDPAAPERVVVIGHALWQQDYGGRPDVLGQTIVLDNNAHTIIGVAPKGFTGPELTRVDVWLPESLLGRGVVTNWTQSWNGNWLYVIVRLKDGVDSEQADAEMTLLHQQGYTGPDPVKARATLAGRPIRFTPEGVESTEASVSKWLLAVAAIVLVIAVANVINLALARAVRRRREIAVRVTVGAGRGRVVRLLVTEALALGMAGGAMGLVLAGGLAALMRRVLLPNVEWTGGWVSPRVIGVAALVALGTGLIVGLVTAVQASAPDLTSGLRTGAREGGGRTGRLRTALTIAQAALAVVLLVGAGLFVQSLRRVRGLDLGIEPDRVLTFSVLRAGLGSISDTAERRLERRRRAEFYPAALERIRQLPVVEAASLSIGVAFASGYGQDIRVPGRDSIPRLPGGGPYLAAVTADYFRTMGTRVVRGRAFTPADRAGSAAVAIVDETMAATLWPGEDPIGKCFVVSPSEMCAEVVGVAGDARRFELREDAAMFFYIPHGQEQQISGTQLLVRPRGDPKGAIAEVRAQLLALDPSIVFVRATVLQDLVDPQLRPWRLGATMFSLMGLLALLVAAVGLYGVLSYLVAHRAHEISVRIALGARARDVARLVFRGGFGMAGVGVLAGLVLALPAARFVAPLLFDTSPADPVVYGSVALVLLGVAALASIVPAARARRVSPMEAMRAD